MRIVATLALMTIAATATAAVPPSGSRLRAQAAPPAGTGPAGADDATLSGSVAVIPFTNISRDETDDWIGDGIAETVTADLEALGDLTVIARERIRAAAGRLGDADLDDVMVTALGRELGARWVVTGGYQRLGNQLRITARLVDTTSGLIARTVKADGALDDIFDLQDRIATELTTDVGSSTMARRGSRVRGRPGIAGQAGEGSDPGAAGNVGNAGDAGNGGSDRERPADTLRPAQVTGGIILPDADTANRARGGGPGAARRGGPSNRGAAGGRGVPPGGVGTAASAGVLTGRPSVTAARAAEPPRIDG